MDFMENAFKDQKEIDVKNFPHDEFYELLKEKIYSMVFEEEIDFSLLIYSNMYISSATYTFSTFIFSGFMLNSLSLA